MTKKEESVTETTAKASDFKPRAPYGTLESSSNTKKHANFSHLSPQEIQKLEDWVDAYFSKNDLKKLLSIAKLVEADAGRATTGKYWNPKMKDFTMAKKNGRIIDLRKTLIKLNDAYSMVKHTLSEGGKILFVGTSKDYIKNFIAESAKETKSLYVNKRWLGGTLTNFNTVKKSIGNFNRLLELKASGEISKYSKREQLEISRQINKYETFIGGIRLMTGMPQLVIVADPITERNAVIEAHQRRIPVIALTNTSANPHDAEYIIPCNTLSTKVQWLILSVLFDAIREANGEKTTVVGHTDSRIVLPQLGTAVVATEEPKEATHKSFSRFSK